MGERGPFHRFCRPPAPGDGRLCRPAGGRAAAGRLLGLLHPRKPLRCRLCLACGRDGVSPSGPLHAGGRAPVRARLCGGRQTVPESWRMAGHFMGAHSGCAGHAGAGARHTAAGLGRHQRRELGCPRLCVALQHADRLRLLVSRAGAGRHRADRPAPALAALHRASPGGPLPGRADRPRHALRDLRRRPVRGRRAMGGAPPVLMPPHEGARSRRS